MRCSLYLATGCPDEILLEDALDVVGMAVMLGRAVEARKWVEELRQQAAAAAFDGLM